MLKSYSIENLAHKHQAKKFDLQGEGHETTTCGQIIENQLTGENEKRGILWEKNQLIRSNLFLKLKIGTLVHKIQYQKKDTPPALYDLVQPASAVHNYNTRYATNQNLCRPFSRTNYGLARFSVVASQTWEAKPMKIKCLPLNSFKKEYKLFLYLTVKHLEQL